MKLPVMLLGLGLAASAAHAIPAHTTASRLPMLNDDYAKARLEAQRRHVPIFAEVWAPW